MGKAYVLYNPKAGNAERAEALMQRLRAALAEEDPEYIDITQIDDHGEFFCKVTEEDKIYICGGDGTLNRFVNDMADVDCRSDVYYYATGTGNDFLNDVAKGAQEPILINKYITDLPTVEVNGRKYKFINGVGYGIDGYCCEVGDAQKERSTKPVNYTMIAIKGLLFHFKPVNATVTVDGVEHKYKRVWIAPSMNGRFYGGGMMPTPDQDRLNTERKVSLCLMHGAGKLRTLTVFPSIFKGEHVKHSRMVSVHTGHSITVRFDRPTALQIDGETVKNVSEYHVEGGAV